ncbi:30S ribosomal protein S6 modification enzyme RimK [Candidatus Magnetomorum sp. HK-1]|nr:30S ribosomal protein S6 modification enzyme RimK [Candidatus Magnetomorum sp. HK-1]
MGKNLKIGLWIPQREDLHTSMTQNNPAFMDVRIYKLLLDYLNERNVDYIENLDFRKAIIKKHQVFINDFCLSDLDHFIWMGMLDRSWDSYHLEVLRVLELSVTVHNPYSFYNVATDKFSVFSYLHTYNVPVPELYIVNPNNFQSLEPLFEHSSFLLKPRRSDFGMGIIKLDNYAQFRDIVEYYSNKHYYLEKFYKNDLSQWRGVTVLNGHVLYSFRKKSSKIADWKVYDRKRLGGETIYMKPNREIEAIALEIGDILGANYFGLDFIKTASG